jgi:hypothetical protein
MHLYDSSLFLEYKDKFCEILMDKSVDYYNTTMDLGVALGFLEVVQKIEGSPSIMRRLQESKNTLFRIKKEETEPLIKLYLEKNKEYPEFCFYRNELVVTQKKFFTGKHLDTILYKNVEGYSFSIVRETTNFITHVYHVLTIVTSDKNYCYNYTSGGWNDTTKTDFCGILGVWEKLVADILVDKILYVIFDLNERYKIGSLILDNQGIREKGFFRDSILRWEDMKYEPTIASGSVCIFTEKNKTFTILSLSEINAPIIPLLFKKIISEELYRVTI